MSDGWKYALHSVSYSGSWGQATLPVERFLERAKALGFDGVMLMAKRPHVSPLDLDADARARLRHRIDELGLELACLAGYNDFSLGLERPDVPMAEVTTGYLVELCRLARDLGGATVRVFTGFERPDAAYDVLWRRVVSGLKETARRAADLGVTLAVQNHHDLGAHHLSLRDLLQEVDEPNCRAAFDAWTPALHGQAAAELAEAVALMAPWTIYTTAADYQRRPRYRYQPQWVQFDRGLDVMRMVPMGEGCVDYPSFFRALEASGYCGYVAFEMCAPLQGGGSEENLDRCARGFLDYMRGGRWKAEHADVG
jgi:sugar phosphate isomerase/epimerase